MTRLLRFALFAALVATISGCAMQRAAPVMTEPLDAEPSAADQQSSPEPHEHRADPCTLLPEGGDDGIGGTGCKIN